MQYRSSLLLNGFVAIALISVFSATGIDTAFAQYPYGSSVSSLPSSTSSVRSSTSSSYSSSSSVSSSSSSCAAIPTLTGAGFEAKPVSSKNIAVRFTKPANLSPCWTLHYDVQGTAGGMSFIAIGTSDDKWVLLPVYSLTYSAIADFTIRGRVSLVDSTGFTVVMQEFFVTIHPIQPMIFFNSSSTFTTISYMVTGGKGPYFASGVIGPIQEFTRDQLYETSTSASDTYDLGTPGCVDVIIWAEYELNGETYADDTVRDVFCTSF